MRVLHILNELLPSGAETMLRAAGPFWSAQDIEGSILATGDRPGEFAPRLAEAGFTLHHLPFRRSPAFLLAYYRLLRRHRFDRIHIHCERANVWYALLARLAGHRGIVRSIHGTFAFRGGLRLRRGLQRWLLRRLLGVRHIAAGPSVGRIEWETFRNPAEPILNWFDERRLASPLSRAEARRALGIPDTATVLVTIGNCAPVKNHRAVLEALAHLPASLDLLYLHVGREEPAAADRAAAADLGVAGRVRFCGPVFEIAPILAAADLFLMPSLHEGLGIAAIEAMAAGVPVLLADVAGLCDLRPLAPEAAWTAPDGVSLAAGILRFLGLPPAERTALGQALRRRIHAACGMERGAGRYAALYREVGIV